MARIVSYLPGSYGSGSNITRTSQLINDGDDPNDGLKFLKNDADLQSIIETHIVDTGVADKNFVYDSLGPRMIWDIPHTLEKKVSVTVVDTAGTTIEGVVTINNINFVQIKFNVPVEGYAFLN